MTNTKGNKHTIINEIKIESGRAIYNSKEVANIYFIHFLLMVEVI